MQRKLDMCKAFIVERNSSSYMPVKIMNVALKKEIIQVRQLAYWISITINVISSSPAGSGCLRDSQAGPSFHAFHHPLDW
jgi:hypothetical protein